MKAFVGAVLLSAVLCVCDGFVIAAVEGWTHPNLKASDQLDLLIGLGVLSIFPGCAWALLERKLPEVGAARRRLVIYSLASSLLVGCGLALLLAVLAGTFSQTMKRIGFLPPDASLLKAAGTGFVYGSLPGLALGYLAAAAQTFLWPNNRSHLK